MESAINHRNSDAQSSTPFHFANHPLTDFSLEENRARMTEALAKLEQKISSGSLKAFPIVSGRDVKQGKPAFSLDPADPEIRVATVTFADRNLAEQALQNLSRSRATLDKIPASDRSQMLHRLAELMRRDYFKLCALLVREAGKTWREADGEAAEAVDFCDYYASQMMRLSNPIHLMPEIKGESNHYLYRPRGVAVAIAPWNFPLAIACGMTVAALVTGNPCALKPSEQTSMIGYEFAKLILEAGIPAETFAYLPGDGEEVGAYLVEHPLVDIIAFTGSRAVGLWILSRGAQIKDGQRGIKKVITELGGKNAIIVDSDADNDEAIKGILSSSFGFAGQKCSACSRLIVVGKGYSSFMERLCLSARDLIIGAPSDPATFISPVIDSTSKDRILQAIDRAKSGSKLAFQGEAPATGNFVPPSIFVDTPPTSQLWKEEIFGPVLASRKVDTFQQAITLANDSAYALTGGVFSRSPANIEYAAREFEVGNLYINRGITGALVGRQPFGGFKLSGIGAKAGGPDYLLQFLEPRTITENTTRRGFSPDL